MQLVNDLSVKLKRYQSEISASINRVVDSGWLVLGPEVERFESLFADYHASNHCIGVANGTEAIELALKALGIGSKSRVATVANAGAYTSNALTSMGASPVFVEVDHYSQCATLASVEAALERNVDAVVLTHLFGRLVPEVEQIAALCKRKSVPLMEDCAQAHGASLGGTKAGCFGDIASFSFYPTKNLGALGDGGAVLTNNQHYAEIVSQLRQYGWTNKYQIGVAGGRNSRLDAIQAAVLSEFLPHLDTWNDERISIALQYENEITNPLISKPPINQSKAIKNDDDKPYVAHLYVIRSEFRDELSRHLRSKNILTEVHYPIPDHKQSIIVANQMDLSMPVTENLARSILTLPCYPGMSQQQIKHVIEAVNSWAI